MKKELQEQKDRIISIMEQIEDVTHKAFSNTQDTNENWVEGLLNDFEQKSQEAIQKHMASGDPPMQIDAIIHDVVDKLYEISKGYLIDGAKEDYGVVMGMIEKLQELLDNISQRESENNKDNFDPHAGGFGFPDGRDTAGNPI